MLSVQGSADKYSTASVNHSMELRWHYWSQDLQSCPSALTETPEPAEMMRQTKSSGSLLLLKLTFHFLLLVSSSPFILFYLDPASLYAFKNTPTSLSAIAQYNKHVQSHKIRHLVQCVP